jgi:hypothetical protein
VVSGQCLAGGLELRGLTEAVESRNWPLPKEQLDRLLRAVSRNAELLEKPAAY